MSIRNTFPTIRPSLNLNFARSRTLDPRITFSRTTTGTYMDVDGLIKVASADEARFDHRYVNGQLESLGLLVEESRVNYARFSGRPDVNWIIDVSDGNGLSYIDGETVTSSSGGLSATYVAELSTSSQIVIKFSSGYPAGVLTGSTSGATRNITSRLSIGGTPNVSAILTNEVASPDGTQNALLVTPTTAGTQLRHVSKTYVTSTAGTYAYSIFFKNKNISNNTVAIRLSNETATAHVRLNFNFATKIFGGVENSSLGGWTGTYGYEDYPNGWIRLWVTATTTEGSHTFISGNLWLAGYQGSDENIGSLYLWESQIEQGAFPTSQIKTTLSTVTRTADNASITGTNFSDWFNNNEFSIFTYHKFPNLPSNYFPRVFDINNGNDTYRLNHYHDPSTSGTRVGASVVENNVAQFVVTTSSYNIGDNLKIASCFKDNDFASYANGVLIGTDNSGVLSAIQRSVLYIGSSANGSSPINGTISQLSYYPRRLTNTELQNLTK